RVPREGESFPARVRVPQAHRPILAAAGQALAVRTPGHARDRVRVTLEGEGDLARRRVQDAHRPVGVGAGEAPAVGADAHTRDRAVAPAELAVVLTGSVPHLNQWAIRGAAGAPLPVRA